MTGILKDIRYGARVLAKTPGFTAVAALSLALGIGVNTTVFSWIEAILLEPLPGVDPKANLLAFETVAPNGEFLANSYPDYRDYRDHLTTISGLAVAQPNALSMGEEDRSEPLWGELVSGNYFAVLGVTPLAGRVFLPDEYGDKPGAYPVAVISERIWRSRFHADPSVVGRTIRINRYPLTLVGVVPRQFRGTLPGLSFDIWIPLMMGPQLNGIGDWMLRDRKTRNVVAVARLKPGAAIERSRSEVASLAKELAKMDPYTNGGITATLLPIGEAHFGAQSALRRPLQVLMAVCVVVLVIVCANVANLLLARSIARKREFTLRLALGAGRGRVARQIVTESLLLAVAGAAIGVPLALFLGRTLGYLLPPTGLPLEVDVRVDGAVLLFAALVCAGSALLTGLMPAVQAGRGSLSDDLKEGGRSASSAAPSHRARAVLVAAEVALALVTVVAAGLFTRSFDQAKKIERGFDARNVLVSHFQLSTSGYPLEERKQFCRRLRAELERTPGVLSAVYADHVPLGFAGAWWEDLQIEGYVPGASENLKIPRAVVAPGYFDLMRIPLVDGRDFREDDREDSLQVMIVNQAFARRFFAGRNPVGRRVRGWGRWFTVVGVAKDSKYNHVAEAPLPFFYVAFRQVYRADMLLAFYLRVPGDPKNAVPALRAAVRRIDPNVGVFRTTSLEEYTGASLYAQKVAAVLLAVLGAVALALATLGLYSSMAYMVGQRTQEVGIRMALGAEPRHVLGMVIGRGMALAGAGLVAGIALALVSMRLVRGMLVGITANDPRVFAGAVLFLCAVAALACSLPAGRATRLDPIRALRHE